MQPKMADLIYGRHPVLEALREGVSIEKLLLLQGTRGTFEKELRQLTREANVPVQMVPKERLNKLVGGNHQGIVGFVSPIQYQRLEHVLPLVYERGETPLLLLLDGVTDTRNFGAIARSAELAGVHALVVGRKNSAQINADALKTSAGALTRLLVCREQSIPVAMERLKMSGIRVLATELRAERYVYEEPLNRPVALVVGSEGQGIGSETRRSADGSVRIPQVGTMDSFNVSVTAGILLYEVMRQRLKEGK